MKIEPKTLKGFRDFLPAEARKRQYVKNTLKRVFESYGFEPLETPTLEYTDILTGKYGEEADKLMYKFKDNGGRDVAMRYDQTVPLARVVAQYSNNIPLPFKRYQIQNVYRAENTQKGRFREFLQCDIDTVGTSSPKADAEVIACASSALRALGFQEYRFFINDRKVFKDISKISIGAIDKLKKIGEKQVVEELVKRGEYDSSEDAQRVLLEIKRSMPTPWIKSVIDESVLMGVKEDQIEFMPTLARGLDYYTSTIIELEIGGYDAGSVGGGGRFDNLIGLFLNKKIPAIGFSFGFDRLIDVMDKKNLFKNLSSSKILILYQPDLTKEAYELADKLRIKGINAEVSLDLNIERGKQFAYAEKKGIPFALVLKSEGGFELRWKEKSNVSSQKVDFATLLERLK